MLRQFIVFFIEHIKAKYRRSVSEESVFNIILCVIKYVIISAEIVYFLYFIANIFKEKENYNPTVLFDVDHGIIGIIGMVIAAVIVFVPMSLGINFMRLMDSFKSKLETGNIDDKKDFYKRRINLNIFFIGLLLCIFFLPFIIVGYEIIKIKSMLSALCIAIGFTLTMGIILHSLYKAWKDIYDESIYVLEGDGIFITCKLYLVYSDYFLIVSEQEEKFIAKSKVGIIRKIKVLNEINM